MATMSFGLGGEPSKCNGGLHSMSSTRSRLRIAWSSPSTITLSPSHTSLNMNRSESISSSTGFAMPARVWARTASWMMSTHMEAREARAQGWAIGSSTSFPDD
eukprot:CAMPEP_0180589916 /NCGR_PEP_ID=MMETSP1037_2-20121125/18401_1 /TAXON_ID=632150 /ORGANISM="Azadinium spinosum, Strain 3D9" /LENGTH=102 /DNA_ID=CAMNT_0022608119 /DNA_START=152 /DNA_END=460 /DNA_ORIENTATION=+